GLVKYPLRDGKRLLGELALEMPTQPGIARQELIAALVDALVIVLARPQPQPEMPKPDPLIQGLLASSSDPLLLFGADWRLILVTPAASTIFAGIAAGMTLEASVQSGELVAFVENGQPIAEMSIGEKTFVPHLEAVGSADDPEGWILALRDVTQFKKLNRSQS